MVVIEFGTTNDKRKQYIISLQNLRVRRVLEIWVRVWIMTVLQTDSYLYSNDTYSKVGFYITSYLLHIMIFLLIDYYFS